ncbi:MAG: ribosomal protein large subunit ribosomal protein [Patescibacteria group bacterium]|nr:ribosomal protein large subunit ribosomal protein [Patescibacteria group bacterium]
MCTAGLFYCMGLANSATSCYDDPTMATAKKTTKTVAVKKTAAKKAAPKAPKSGPFAVIATGGKQYLVRPNDVITVEILDGEFKAGDSISFDQVLLIDDGSTTKIGAPYVAGASVKAAFVEAGRAAKIDVIKYQPKSRYYKKRGHRQPFMKFKIVGF